MVKKVGKYEIGKTLGEGTFGKVKYAVNTDTGERVAIKILDKEKIQKQNMGAQIKKEISIMKMVKHEHVVKLYEVLASRTKIFIVLELVTGGELFDKIVSEGRFNEDTARFYFRQLIKGVYYCHHQGVAHRDLKPENLLLDEHGNLKISDFGLSALYTGGGDDDRATLLHTTCGTPNYVAPEVLNDKGYDGRAADMWSCGVILYVLLAGFLPFDEPHMSALFRKIQKAEFTYPSWFSAPVRGLLDRILVADPSKRLTVEGIQGDAWFNSGDTPDYVGAPPTIPPPLGSSGAGGGSSSGAGAGAGGAATSPPPHVPSAQDMADAVKEGVEETGGSDKAEGPPKLNAFEVVNLFGGMALNRMLEVSSKDAAARRQRLHFITALPVPDILERTKAVLADSGVRTDVKAHKIVAHFFTNEGGRAAEGVAPLPELGEVKFAVELQGMGSALHLVEVRKIKGDSLAFHNMYKTFQASLRAALEDIAGRK